MKWQVSGAWKKDGSSGTMIIEAADAQDVAREANARGLLVSKAVPLAQVEDEAAPTSPALKAAVAVGGSAGRMFALFGIIVGSLFILVVAIVVAIRIARPL